MGIGGCIRDSSGNWIKGFSQSLDDGDALTSELKAILTGLNLFLTVLVDQTFKACH